MKKKLLLRRPLCVLIIIALVFSVYGIILLVRGDEHNIYVNYSPQLKCEKAEVLFGEKMDRTESDLIEVEEIKIFDGYVRAKYKAVAKGSEMVSLNAYSFKDGVNIEKTVNMERIGIGPFNILSCNLYQYVYIVLAFLSFLICLYYIYCFINTVKTRRYSYDTIFFLSVVLIFALLLCIWGSASVYSFMQYHTTSSTVVYSVNRDLMTVLSLATLPLMFVFVLSVSVSNITLMVKEGFRPANALGLITSFVMLAGLLAIVILHRYMEYSDSLLLPVVYSIGSSLYVFFVIILVSAIAYGIYASKHTPDFDKDYIIILGCRIRKDGTLYPLIRGRADKAIEFYKKQLAVTGKQACFVPSGGKGSDEIMPEAEAIKNYLVGEGIPEDSIIVENKSATTRENMKFSKAIIDEKTENAKIIFSTTSYHVFRSGAIAYHNGINIDGIGSKTKWYFWPNAFLREVAGIFVTQPKKQIIIIAVISLLAGLASFAYSLF